MATYCNNNEVRSVSHNVNYEVFSIMLLIFADMNYKFPAVQEGEFWSASDGGRPDREMGNKTMQVHFPPGATEPGRMQHTMVEDAAFPKTFLRRNLPGWMPSLATDSQGLTIQQRKCLAFYLPDARPVKWNLRRLTHRLWLPASPVTVWQQALAKEGRGSMKRIMEHPKWFFWLKEKAYKLCYIGGRTGGFRGRDIMLPGITF